MSCYKWTDFIIKSVVLDRFYSLQGSTELVQSGIGLLETLSDPEQLRQQDIDLEIISF